MRRTLRTFLTPGWIGLHLLVLTSAVAMILLGRWQLQVSNRKHFDLQNFGYAFQWWAFSGFAVWLWAKAIRDAVRGRRSQESTGGQLVRRVDPSGTAVAYAGPADLIGRARPGEAPAVYRGYVMPQSTTRPAGSEGDPVRAAYNDYLWQLALADSAGRPDRADPVPVKLPPAGAGADET